MENQFADHDGVHGAAPENNELQARAHFQDGNLHVAAQILNAMNDGNAVARIIRELCVDENNLLNIIRLLRFIAPGARPAQIEQDFDVTFNNMLDRGGNRYDVFKLSFRVSQEISLVHYPRIELERFNFRTEPYLLEGGIYYFRNVHTGRYLDMADTTVYGRGNQDGGQNGPESAPHPAQEWEVRPSGRPSIYYFRNVHQGRYLDGAGTTVYGRGDQDGQGNGPQAHNAHQEWEVQASPYAGIFYVRNVSENRHLDMAGRNVYQRGNQDEGQNGPESSPHPAQEWEPRMAR